MNVFMKTKIRFRLVPQSVFSEYEVSKSNVLHQIFGSTNCLETKFFIQKFLDSNFCGPEMFLNAKFLGPKTFSYIFLDQTVF